MNKEIEQISIPVWWKPGGGMMYRRDCLPIDHPEHTYNYIVREYGVRPELYGIEKPIDIDNVQHTCPSCGYVF